MDIPTSNRFNFCLCNNSHHQLILLIRTDIILEYTLSVEKITSEINYGNLRFIIPKENITASFLSVSSLHRLTLYLC